MSFNNIPLAESFYTNCTEGTPQLIQNVYATIFSGDSGACVSVVIFQSAVLFNVQGH